MTTSNNLDGDADVDVLLSGLEQMTNILYWHQTRSSLPAAVALTEALDDWISEHAAEHRHSQPFLNDDSDGGDPFGAALAHLAAAVTTMHATGARPLLTLTDAFTEAIAGWVAAVTAEHHHSQPLQTVMTSPSTSRARPFGTVRSAV